MSNKISKLLGGKTKKLNGHALHNKPIPKRGIVKVIDSTMPDNPNDLKMWCHDEVKAITFIGPMPEHVAALMNKMPFKFFYYKLEGTIVMLKGLAPDQNW